MGDIKKTFERSDSVPQCSTSYTKFPIQIYRLLYAAALPTGCRGVLCPNAFWVSQNAIRLCKVGLPHLCPSAAHTAHLCHVAISLPYAPSNAVSGVSATSCGVSVFFLVSENSESPFLWSPIMRDFPFYGVGKFIFRFLWCAKTLFMTYQNCKTLRSQFFGNPKMPCGGNYKPSTIP